jgi:predicted metal-dependent enzyme (double-stranded beta helix superfamily)
MKTHHNTEQKNLELTRRGVIKTLGLGLSFAALPAFMSSAMTEVSIDALDPGEHILPVNEMELLEMQKFIEDCITANKESNPQEAVKEVLARAVSNPNEMLKAIGEPKEVGMKVFLRSKELTIFAANWAPQMNLMPHNHHMWANIGIYNGREDNILWEREEAGIKATKAACLFAGDVASLSSSAIHSVTNPLKRFTGGIHIYGGDFFETEFSKWNPETLNEEPFNGELIRKMFKKENERMRSMKND